MAAQRERYRGRDADGHTHSDHVRDAAFAIIGVAGFGGLMYFWGQNSKPDCAAEVAKLNTQLLLAQQGFRPGP